MNTFAVVESIGVKKTAELMLVFGIFIFIVVQRGGSILFPGAIIPAISTWPRKIPCKGGFGGLGKPGNNGICKVYGPEVPFPVPTINGFCTILGKASKNTFFCVSKPILIPLIYAGCKNP